MKKIVDYILHPLDIFYFLDKKGIIRIDNKSYIKIHYRKIMHKKLNIKKPKSFNEKLQWLKLYDHRDIYTNMVDKDLAKKHVSSIIGNEYIIPTLGIYNKFDDIDFNKLPNQFVMKCTHDSGGVVICKDKNTFDIETARKKINKGLKYNFFYLAREWPYKNVKPRIIIEKYIQLADTEELIDYKFFCFNGIPKFILACSERYSSNNMCKTFFDVNWNRLNMSEGGHRIDENLVQPKHLATMLELSRKLSKNIPFIRVDFYEVKGKVYFGELTFYPQGGYEKFNPESYDLLFGSWIDISHI